MRKEHREKLAKNIEDYNNMKYGDAVWARESQRYFCTMGEDKDPVKSIDRYLDLEPFMDKGVISIKLIKVKLTIDKGDVILTIPVYGGTTERMLLIEYIDGTQAFLCHNPNVLKALDDYNVYGEYYPRYYSPYHVRNVYDSLKAVIPAFGIEEYTYSLMFDHNVYDTNFLYLCDEEVIPKMSDKARDRLKESYELWSSLWIIARYDRDVINDLMFDLERAQILIREYEKNPGAETIECNTIEEIDNAWFWNCMRCRPCVIENGIEKIQFKNEEYSNERFDFDHLIIAENGIFIIKVMKGDGNLHVSGKGEWYWEEDGNRKGAANQKKWFRNRVKLFRSFISEDIHIRCICCIENDDGIIEGEGSLDLDIVKLEEMGKLMMNYPCEKEYSREEIVSLAEQISKYQVKKINWFS